MNISSPKNALRPFFRRGALAAYIFRMFNRYKKARLAMLTSPRWYI